MKKKILAAAAIALGATAAIAPTAQADGHTLADALLADERGFDSNQNDFDIVTEALLAADADGNLLFPGLVAAAADEDAALTVFLPTDKAFRILVEDLGLGSIKDEEALFNAIVATVGVDRVGQILAYHIAPLVAPSSVVVSLPEGFEVPTVEGSPIVLEFKGNKPQIRLIDEAGPGRDPIVRIPDAVEADNGVAHVIDRVLIPAEDA
jgi:uncharacterized surface protein with fasciclin (FAS1) repeats